MDIDKSNPQNLHLALCVSEPLKEFKCVFKRKIDPKRARGASKETPKKPPLPYLHRSTWTPFDTPEPAKRYENEHSTIHHIFNTCPSPVRTKGTNWSTSSNQTSKNQRTYLGIIDHKNCWFKAPTKTTQTAKWMNRSKTHGSIRNSPRNHHKLISRPRKTVPFQGPKQPQQIS